MNDEKRVPETLETLAQRIAALPTKADLEQFATKTDLERFATKADLAELKSQLRADMEGLRDEVKRVYDVVIAQNDRNKASDADHTAFRTQLDDHDVRILALEKNDRRV